MLYPSVNKQKSWLLFLLIVAISLNLYFHFTFVGSLQNRAQWLDSMFGKLFYPVQKVFTWTEDAAASGSTTLRSLWQAQQENQKLKAALADQILQAQQLEELRIQKEKLEGLLEFKKESKLSLLAAKVVGRDASLLLRTLEIDRGSADNVQEAMAVVSPSGVVGRILKVHPHSSTILLITDINARVDATVQRSRTRVIVGGSAEGDLTLRFLPRRFDLRQGDVLVSSGFGGFFPEGFKIGVVVGFAQDPHFVLEQAELEPVVDFDSLEDVFVVRTFAKWP